MNQITCNEGIYEYGTHVASSIGENKIIYIMATKETLAPNKTKQKVFAKLGYTKLEAAELVDSLNEVLANYNVHYQKLRNFHWNVKGPDFFDIHKDFESQYHEARKNIDEIAERIRVFGQTPFSTFKEYLEGSEIKESGTDLSSSEMVQEILKDHSILLEYMFNALEHAIDKGDSGTEDMLKTFIKSVEKHHWMLTAFSKD